MTLSPVFRSEEAVEVLRSAGIWTRLNPAALGQAEAITCVKQDLTTVLDARYIDMGQLAAEAGARVAARAFGRSKFSVLGERHAGQAELLGPGAGLLHRAARRIPRPLGMHMRIRRQHA